MTLIAIMARLTAVLPAVNYAAGRHHDCAVGVTAVALGAAGLNKLAVLVRTLRTVCTVFPASASSLLAFP